MRKIIILSIIIVAIVCSGIIILYLKSQTSCKISPEYLNGLQRTELINRELSSNQYNMPVGIVALGLSGTDKNWTIYTNSVLGVANISQLNGVSTIGYNHSGSSLQLNAILYSCINDVQKVYWLQDVARFDQYTNKLEFVENIWNFSNSKDIPSNTPISDNQSKSILYELPLNLSLLINVSNGVHNTTVNFYYGIYNEASKHWNYMLYKRVNTNNTPRSRIVIAPAITPANTYYDSEFVFAGPGSKSIEYFSVLNAHLSLFYLNSTSGNYVTFPEYFTKGLDTGEVSYNLKSTILKDQAIVKTNMPSVSTGNVVAVNSSN